MKYPPEILLVNQLTRNLDITQDIKVLDLKLTNRKGVPVLPAPFLPVLITLGTIFEPSLE
jgi:hypothetical protein